MPETEIVRLHIRPAVDREIEIRVVSPSGRDGDEDLTLWVRSGFFQDGEPTSTPLGPDDARALWAFLEGFELRGPALDLRGLDGRTYTLEIHAAGVDESLEWWERVSEGWSDAQRLVDELLRLAGPAADGFWRRA